MDDLSIIFIRQIGKYQINSSQPKIVKSQIFYQDTNQESAKKLRNANLYYSCRNTEQPNQNICAQLIQSEPNRTTEKEIAVLELLSKHPHTNLIKIFDIIKKDHCYAMYEEIPMNLEKFLNSGRNLSSIMKENFYCQLFAGFNHLKSLKIIIRDLQPKHIRVKQIKDNEYVLQISDFRSAEISEDGYVDSINGMSDFAAPEALIKGQSLNNQCSIYTLGMLLYYICNDGRKPFEANSYQDLIKKQREFCQNLLNQSAGNNDHQRLIEQYKRMLVWDKFNREGDDNQFRQDCYLLDNTYFLRQSDSVGRGRQGFVVNAFNIQTRDTLVCKMIQKKEQNNEQDLREVQICGYLEGENHQNIIKIIKIIKDSQWYYIFLEKCDMNIKEFMEQNNQFTDQEIIDFLSQIISGYEQLKRKSIVHRDIKPENIMIKFDDNNDKIYKIIDFGVSKIISGSLLAHTDVGSLLYIAPEVLENNVSGYNDQCDVFSVIYFTYSKLGVLIYYMMYKKEYININGQNEIRQQQKLLKTNPFKCPDSMRNPDLRQLIEKMIVYDPIKRINWEMLKGYRLKKNHLDFLNDIYRYSLFAIQSEELLCELQDKYRDDKVLAGDIYAHRIILLKFANLAFQKIEQSINQEYIQMNETEYKINKIFNANVWKMNNKWNQSHQILKQKQQRLEDYQITMLNDALSVIQNMDIKNSEITLNFTQVHKFYIKLPNLLNNSTFINNESIKLKYHLMKMRNLLNDSKNDSSIEYTLGQDSKILFFDKLSISQMNAYIDENQ
ncbi:unnamed protein product (macronuclear) [Paramecium tetraurelia]|uniref:Protein kinase domain-containing protein n=1 Tax=Paramecium tetraurelia TaxID=5888 RepID=A0EAN7_PARTE|nr:uncharacterized protein GSPATT00025088001 [Paramecium tetraurelia]CAK92354.1 unnamed protein product [Paramecium tetraurelia]|eukprot:XP_001459751.1 hypothetical protein (macronuclear) [Paramecium tetraurelia strain d4-2]